MTTSDHQADQPDDAGTPAVPDAAATGSTSAPVTRSRAGGRRVRRAVVAAVAVLAVGGGTAIAVTHGAPAAADALSAGPSPAAAPSAAVPPVTPAGTSGAVLDAGAPREIPVARQAAAPASTVTLVVGGRRSTVHSAASTVAALLRERHLTVGRQDVLTPSAPTALHDGATVTLRRVEISSMVRRVTLAAPATRTVQDAALDRGTTKVVRKAATGQVTIRYRVTVVDGVRTVRELGRRTDARPVGSIVHVGTRVPDPGSEAAAKQAAARFTYDGIQVLTHDTTFGVNWDGLAMCESTHNPRAVNAYPSAGLPTYGLFQFDIPTWESVGGSGNPMDASPSEQLMRAKLLYQQRGLEPWACAYAAH
ncbi:resuscitation-promoting factor [Nakamurella endophytica]|uniref:resuscitation-promoting factor n=1 Tax=Nakamurella endophytica TaxID=1748367 RepID=UPI00166D9A2C|nr:resuscitation-promoting factor [Nakamurella endophytica]